MVTVAVITEGRWSAVAWRFELRTLNRFSGASTFATLSKREEVCSLYLAPPKKS